MPNPGKRSIRAAVAGAKAALPSTPDGPPPGSPPAFLISRFYALELPEDGRAAGIYRKKSGDDTNDTWVCGFFRAVARVRDGDSRSWGLLLTWHDGSGVLHEVVVPRRLLQGDCVEVRSILSDRGVILSSSRRGRAAFQEYIGLLNPPELARCVGSVGWHEVGPAKVYVWHGGAVFGAPPERVALQQRSESEAFMSRSAGTLEEWREHVAGACNGNTRLIFAVSAALAAPLLNLLGEAGGGFNLMGGSRIGKSIAGQVAASVWGGDAHRGADAFVRGWYATVNGLEALAGVHNDALLVVDELSQVAPDDVGKIAYFLGNGSGKVRAADSGGGRATLRFRMLFLSSGEVGLADLNRLAGKVTRAGEEMRLIDIEADAGKSMGVFEELHDCATPAEFAEHLQGMLRHYYGTAARAYLEQLADRLLHDPVGFPDDLLRRINNLVRSWLDPFPHASGQVKYVARRFALVAVAGELATQMALTGWTAAGAVDAAHQCFDTWCRSRGGLGPQEDREAKKKLRDFLDRYGNSRFELFRSHGGVADDQVGNPDARDPAEGKPVLNRAGWRKWVPRPAEQGGGGMWVFYMTTGAMDEALSGLSARSSKRRLAEMGYILRDHENNLTRSIRVPGYSDRFRLHEISPHIFESTDAAD